MSYRFADSLRGGSEWNPVPSWNRVQDGTEFHPEPVNKLSANLYGIHGKMI
jgi:hypothetical protein